jgi:hypothetical protein
MTTIITRLPYVSADAAALAPIDLTDLELEIFRSGYVKSWYRADGLIKDGLLDRIGGATLAPVSVLPAVSALPAYNGKKAVVFGLGATSGDLAAVGGLPTIGSWSVVNVGRSGAGDNAYLWGDDTAPVQASAGTYLQHSSNGSFTLQIGGTVIVPSTGGFLRPYASGPSLSIASFDDVGDTATLRINRGAHQAAVASGLTGVANASSKLHVGAAGAASAGRIDGGDFAEMLILNVALHLGGMAAFRSLIESYLGTRYGIAAP